MSDTETPTVPAEKAKGFIKKLFQFSGRATVRQYWLRILTLFLLNLAVALLMVLGAVLFGDSLFGGFWYFLCVVLFIALGVASFANFFRRLHDLGLSGYWAFYLSVAGVPAIFCAYAMDADKSVTELVERIKALGRIWGWILAILLWPAGSLFGILMVSFSPGQDKDNTFGENTCPKAIPAE